MGIFPVKRPWNFGFKVGPLHRLPFSQQLRGNRAFLNRVIGKNLLPWQNRKMNNLVPSLIDLEFFRWENQEKNLSTRTKYLFEAVQGEGFEKELKFNI